MKKLKLIRTATISMSLNYLLKGQLSFFNKYFNVIAVSGTDDDLKIVEEREGVKVVSLVMERKIHLIKDLVSLWELYQLFLIEKPNIVHSITPKAGLLSMVAAYFAKVPVRLHTFTGLIFPTKTGLTKIILIITDRILCRCATAIYPEGEGVKSDLIKYGITSKPLKIIANGNVNGIDTEYFNPDLFTFNEKHLLRNEWNIKESDFVFIFVGRLVADKGINELVGAFLKISEKNKQVKLLLVGAFEQELDPLAPETIHNIKENINIISVGFQTDVRLYFSISNALVFPSYREGFPNVVMQAGSMGLPAIVTNINGCNEIIIHEKNGLIIEVKNIKALIEAMQKLIFNLGFLKYLATNSRQMISSRYSQELVWNGILTEYIDLMQNV